MFALSTHFSVPAAAVLYVAGNLIEEITMLDDAHKDTAEHRDNARALQYKIAVAELLGL